MYHVPTEYQRISIRIFHVKYPLIIVNSLRSWLENSGGSSHVFSMGGMSYEERERVSELRAVGLGGYNKPGDITENMIRRELGVRPRATYNLPSSSRNIRQVK